MRRASTAIGLAFLLLAPAPSSLHSQGQESTAADRRQSPVLLTRTDGLIGAGFLAASVALSTFDVRIARFFQDTALAHVERGQRLDDIFTRINETTLTAAGILAYGAGRLTRNNTLTDVAFHATEAIVGASVASQVIRGPLGRSRPHVTGFEDQYDFHWFKGFRQFKYRAFPSIHSGSGFAAATVLVAETSRRNPKANWVVAPLAYGLALTPGLSRMYLGQHWASDVFAGAFMGTFAGWKVVNYSHDHPDNPFDRFAIPGSGLRLDTTDGGNTVRVSWTRIF